MAFSKSGYSRFLSRLLISLVLSTSIQYLLISAETIPPPNDFTTDSSTDVTLQSFNSNPRAIDTGLKLVKQLVAENSNAEVFKDLVDASDEDIVIEQISCLIGACYFRVTYNSKSFVIKQHTFRGADIANAVKLEYKALEQRTQLQPGIVPKPYLLSLQHNCIIMEDFNDYVFLRSVLTSGYIYGKLFENIMKIMPSVAELHNKTFNNIDTIGEAFLTNEVTELLLKRKYIDIFSNTTIEKFTKAGVNISAVEKFVSPAVMEIAKELFFNIFAKKQAVLHGYLTGDNIILRDGDVKLLGNQFAIGGPLAYDIGTLLAQYFITYSRYSQVDSFEASTSSGNMFHASTSLVDDYIIEMGSNVFDEEESMDFISDVAGYCGVELVASVVTDSNNMFAPSAATVLDSGFRLIEGSPDIRNIFDLIVAMF